jgi:anti-sigma regulatory factor (Ser/Thr protein kinase)
MTDAVPLRYRIGGRWAISWLAFALLAVASILMSLQRLAAQSEAFGSGLVLATGVADTAAIALAMLVADRTVLRRRAVTPVSLTVLVGVAAGIGLARAATNILGSQWVGLDGGAADVTIIRSVVIALIVILGVAAVRAEADYYQRRREVLMGQLLEIRARDRALANLSAGMRASIQDEIDQATKGIREQLSATPATAREREDFARGLANAVDRDLRPLSQRLNAATATPLPPPTAGVGRTFWRELRVQPVLSAGVGLALAYLFLSPVVGLVEGLIRSMATALYLLIGTSLTRWAARRNARVNRWQLPVATLVSGILIFANAAAVYQFTDAWTGAPLILAIIVGTPLTITLAGLIAWVQSHWSGAIGDLTMDVDEAQLDALAANREFVRVSRELAQYVHGTLQSHLLATAFAVENAERSHDPELVTAAIEGARAAFARPGEALADDGHDLTAALAEQASVWEGFVELATDIDPSLRDLPPRQAAHIARVVEEAVSNSRKHGGARMVSVRVQRIEQDGRECARVTVIDDGAGPVDGPHGMGSSLLEEIAPGAWSLGHGADGGAVLTATVPLGRA